MLKIKDKRLRIGIVCYPSVGGSGVVATNLGLELANLGHEVHFISYEKPFRLQAKKRGIYFHQVKINEYSLFKYPDYTLPLAEAIVNVHEKIKLDILHVHYAVPHATAALLAKRIMFSAGMTPPKVITTLHGTDITLLAADPNLFTVIKYSIERSDGVTAVSESLKRDTLKVLQTQKPIEVIFNFYSPQKITKTRQAIRQGLKIKDNDFLAIHISNLRPVKRIPDLLKIVAKVKNCKLLVLAGGDFKPYLPLVKKLGIQKNVIVKERVTDIQNYIAAADIGIYPSETESFGMGILESMSYGKPILATKTGGIPEVMRDGQDGFLFKVGDVAAFAKKLRELMLNPRLLQTLGEQAKQHAVDIFSTEKIVKQYLEYYCKILG